MNAERKIFFVNSLSPRVPTRLGADDNFGDRLDARDQEWTKKWNRAFSKTPEKPAIVPDEDRKPEPVSSPQPTAVTKTVPTETTATGNWEPFKQGGIQVNQYWRKEILQPTPEPEPKPVPEIKTGIATWNGQPVNITDYAGKLHGRDYVFIEGASVAIPLDEITYPKEDAKQKPDETAGTSKAIEEEKTRKAAEDAEKEKKQRELEEENRRLKEALEEVKAKRIQDIEQARKQAKEEGESEGKGELMKEFKRKRGLREKLRIMFRPKKDDLIEQELSRRYRISTIGVAVPALAGIAIAYLAGMYLNSHGIIFKNPFAGGNDFPVFPDKSIIIHK